MNKKGSFAVVLPCALLAAFLFGEMLVRASGHFDREGNFFVRSFQCYPYRIPLHDWNQSLNQYRTPKKNLQPMILYWVGLRGLKVNPQLGCISTIKMPYGRTIEKL